MTTNGNGGRPTPPARAKENHMRKNIMNRAVPTPTETAAPALVTVKATGWIGENGVTYKPSDTFQTTAKRAAALGKNVVLVKE